MEKSQPFKITGYLTLIVWIALSVFEILTFFLINPKPIYFRAWEYVSNYSGLDAAFAPFKPLAVYNGTMTGDLLNAIQFKPLPSEIRRQYFQVDEFGYRNPVGISRTPLDAIVVGSSFVAGAQTDQKDLVTEILTNQYNIKSYNYVTSVQYLWEDWRFKENPPKYVILLGSEGEIISSLWKYSIIDRVPYNNPKAWSNFKQWQSQNEFFSWRFDKAAVILKDYSLTRHLMNNLFIDVKNRLFTREQIANSSLQNAVTYDPKTKMLFFQLDYDNPTLNSQSKTLADIETAILEFKKTRDLLASRGITLIISAMPSKTHLETLKYRNMLDKERAILVLYEELKKVGIEYIDLYSPTMEYVKTTGEHLYLPDDSHWSATANMLIANLLSKKISELSNK
ncbi:hypothetical protein A2631_02865 [Candidatus Daviesbacteria bacterium RIFCSPHIGHO2_01_FULL_44_29]|uniref:AlgX/AlgJ SGNH hydrolase-like domain-containing protein n=1 Tax=Candidatus Daviesbacteria bacterium RIFCSPHIGHO2_02_FULL_43_12 TaxID=1797776 RepID=A0A1F5KKK8_9BACT|nr:MAG: hypothetical protein A2631_02865 [Candidatus Daviesbacteria bacterium RIFCSPHIGHO2_01_FULL_44_29]OGE40822.1 MAG: hypothetical protein A3E86_02485 [Candidatus Daviesbacteria bacterium RIFCSPHIGHO2_12_FULL_47_45]OGE41325.1 MAG: hypothetical protein A3D25_02260 [Candidatus Daviesbacteria bacterium RIFCSPHIGHO2_02_FULL_43_12]OGE69526.1 MAG: hypothetical protein A3B55_04000 [Candidatus Daviesbacteria bacterium RIFCSPLOWO2_01_FULL_43_15]